MRDFSTKSKSLQKPIIFFKKVVFICLKGGLSALTKMHRLKGDLRFSDFLTSYAFRCGRRRYLHSKNQLCVDLDSLFRAFAFSTPFTGTIQNLCCGSYR